ncbi:hypothetical protein JY432_02180 [Stenotrophomonas maltophilia]|nr:hypothetical protein [Stenotrophomonas maltophilia]
MSIWGSVFRCDTLGVEDCVIWWDALAAVGSLGAVLATAVLGWFTYRLGKSANRASRLAVRIAGKEARRQSRRDRKERTLVLVQINGEVIWNKVQVSKLHAKVKKTDAMRGFVLSDNYRLELLNELLKIKFPTTAELADRLHYLDEVVGPTLVRCIGILGSTAQRLQPRSPDMKLEEVRMQFVAIQAALGVVVEDLGTVQAACEAEIARSGIDKVRIARLKAQLEADQAAELNGRGS